MQKTLCGAAIAAAAFLAGAHVAQAKGPGNGPLSPNAAWAIYNSDGLVWTTLRSGKGAKQPSIPITRPEPSVAACRVNFTEGGKKVAHVGNAMSTGPCEYFFSGQRRDGGGLVEYLAIDTHDPKIRWEAAKIEQKPHGKGRVCCAPVVMNEGIVSGGWGFDGVSDTYDYLVCRVNHKGTYVSGKLRQDEMSQCLIAADGKGIGSSTFDVLVKR